MGREKFRWLAVCGEQISEDLDPLTPHCGSKLLASAIQVCQVCLRKSPEPRTRAYFAEIQVSRLGGDIIASLTPARIVPPTT